jgi:LmbE family N-acetylglucosaminyl deacetylase
MRLLCLLLLLPLFALSQSKRQPDAAEIKLKLKKLNVLGSVLYVAAHPDDENTAIITQMANGRLVEAAYLSMTRGDGGQNLIGSEIRDLLGLIRTQELLSARRIDGGKQFFTRANDFGFSKSADETFKLWNKQEILHDVVKVFRQFQPDVIITRFPPDERAGHGHHTASAILAQEAFDIAAQASAFPEEAAEFGTWQVKRLYTNTGRWWNQSVNENTPGVITINIGGYSPLLGVSYSEIAAISRSQHKSQGFGSRGSRGDRLEFLEYVKGEKAEKDVFDGINTSWSRVKNSEKVQALVDKAIKDFDSENPSASLSILIQIRKAIASLEPGVWQQRKLKETEQLISDCLGLFLEVTPDNFWVAPSERVVVNFELVNRSPVDVVVERIQSQDLSFDSTVTISLKNNVGVQFKSTRNLNANEDYSGPYWLQEPHGVGLFTVKDKNLIGRPESDPPVSFTFQLNVGGEKLSVVQPLRYKWTDAVKENSPVRLKWFRPFFVNLTDNVMIFNDETSQ